MALMAYGVIGRGMLSGEAPRLESMNAQDIRRRLPRFQGDTIEQNLKLRSALEALAHRKSLTLAQLAIAWAKAQGAGAGLFIVPIPGAKSSKHLEENVRAADIVLTTEDLAQIDVVVPPGAAAGTRYPAGQMHRLNV
jgi:aryl-alcohol dehydrogenase-like predicted oxidoreductase